MPSERSTDNASLPPLDVPTVLAIAVTVWVGAKVVHEAFGHGLVCVGLGGTLRAVSSSWCDCSREGLGPVAERLIKAAGTGANLLAGGLGVFGWKFVRARAGATAYACWLFATVNLFMAGGYLLVDPLFRFGDWGVFLQGLPGGWGPVLSVSGFILYVHAFKALSPLLDVWVGAGGPWAVSRARRLTLLPWLAVGGVFMTLAALRNSLGFRYAWTSALATVAGTSVLVWMPRRYRGAEPGAAKGTPPPAPLVRRLGWWGVGALTALFALGWLGPGISFR